MEIKLAKIDQSQISFFEKMDPFFMLERIVLPEYFAFTAAIPGTEDEEDTPVGLLVGSLSEDSVNVNWLYVEEGFRGEGIGEQLLVKAIEAAEEAGIDSVTACFDDRMDRDEICLHEEIYFKERDFTEWVPLPDEWETDVDQMQKRGGSADGKVNLEAFRAFSEDDQKEIIRECLETPEGRRFIPYSAEHIDPDICFYADYKGKAACVLFAGCENVVFPFFLSDTADKVKDALLLAAASAIRKKYGPDTFVVMQKDDDHTDTFPTWMFEGKNRIDRWGFMR